MTIVNRSVRLTAYSTNSLNINTHNNGEIFFDDDENTLRIYDGRSRGGAILANRPWVTQTVNNSISTTVGLAVSQLEANQKKTSFSTTPPANPTAGDTWVNVSNGNMYVYFNDGTSSQWIQPARNTISLSTVGLGSLSSGTGVSQTYLDTSINNILGAAPSNLNTLGKLAQAMNNDPAFLTTLNNTISDLTSAPVTSSSTGFTDINVSGQPAIQAGNSTSEFDDETVLFDNETVLFESSGTLTLSGSGLVSITTNAGNNEIVIDVAASADTLGLGNVTNQSKSTMFNNPTFTGTVVGVTKAMVGLGNVTNESKVTMFSTPSFTGTVSGVTATHVGLGNVTNESKTTMFSNPTFTGAVSGVTKAMVGLGNVTNESKATLFASPTFSGTPLAPTAIAGTSTQQVATTEFVSTAVVTAVTTINPTPAGTINNVTIGATTALSGAFTSLSATSVSGTGFSSYLASPPAIGSTTASTGKFTTLIATDVTASSGASTGAVTVAGGIGVNGVSYFGAAVFLAGNPTTDLQAATKGYVDASSGGAWSTITIATSAVAGAKYFANTATASFTITLPATPAINTTIYIADLAGTFDRNNLTVARNSSLIMGLTEDLILNIKNVSIALVYSGATYGWKLV